MHKVSAFGLYGKSPHLHFISGSIFLQNLVPAAPLPCSCYKRNQHTPIFGRIKKCHYGTAESKYHIFDEEKGYSSSSHYRISSVVDESERLVATKFVQWDVEPLETLSHSKVYLLRVKLNRGERMSREEKNWLAEAVNTNTYFRTAVPLWVIGLTLWTY